MELSEREKNAVDALSGTAKSALSLIPGLGQAIAGWDSYKRSAFERNLNRVISHLQNKIEDLSSFTSGEWIQSEDGQEFARKIFDSAFDAQMEEKQELFINALINGVSDQSLSKIEKLKFVDILRHLSLAALMVLSDMHILFKDRTKRPGKPNSDVTGSPLVDSTKVAEELNDKHHPYLVHAAICEMESQGLFSNIHEWRERPSGGYASGTYFDSALSYTDFTFRFVEFISSKESLKELSEQYVK